ncbi:MAG: AMP-binding protein [Pseudomonadota bacterium]
MNLGLTLTQAALKWPDKTGLVFDGRRWTYLAWNRVVNQAAHAFAARGIGRGDRVAFLTWNLPEQVTGFYGLLKLGAVPVPINYRLAATR